MNSEQKGTKLTAQILEGERRMHSRFDVDLPVRYCQPDSLVGRNGRALNVSEGGMLICSPEQMEIGQQLKLRLSFISGADLDSVEAVAEVIWWGLYLWEAWGDYRTGMKFIRMLERDNQKLKHYISKLSC